MLISAGRRAQAVIATLPGLVFPALRTLREEKPILAPLLVGWICSGVTARLMWTHVRQLPQDAEAQAALEVAAWLVVGLAPLAQLAKAGLLAVFAWAIVSFSSEAPPLRALLSIFLYAHLLIATEALLAGVALSFVALVSGPLAPESVLTSFNAGALLGMESGPLAAALSVASPGHAAWLWFVARALESGAGVSRGVSRGIALTLWLGVAAASALRVAAAA